ncbi:MAG TPA: thioredoxin [Polyangiaceae bacterium]|jgi:thioredoxin 1/putative thioredoxin|nr:thioredoxin [Polyangiaceae bacterium]
MAALTPITERNFESEILRSDLPVLIEFGAEWCGPCKAVAPELQALQAELQGQAKIVTIDIDKSPVLAQQFRVQSVPTFVVFAQGRPVGARAGAMNKKQLRALIEPFLPRQAGAIKPQEAAMLLKQQRIQMIDTRDADVFNRKHIEGAQNFPIAEIEGRLAELHMLAAPPVLYCRTGELTKELAAKLAAGGTPVAFLEGGVLNWEASGFELVRPD